MTILQQRSVVLTLGAALAISGATLAPQMVRADSCGGYTVQPGDTLNAIAQRNQTTASTLASVNHIANPNLIFSGQCLAVSGHIPAPAASSAPTTSTHSANQSAQGSDVRSILTQAALDHGVDPALMRAVAWHESGWNQSACGSSGEIGMMQILPATAAGINAAHGSGYNVWTAYGNAELGALFLRDLLNQNGGCLNCAISAYNQGEGNYQAHGISNWNNYVGPVLGLIGKV